MIPACLYDAEDRCGPDQELSGTQACVCRDGLVLVGTSCEPCPEHELEVDGVCECEADFERIADGQACTPVVVGGLGAACSPSQPCVDDVFDTCQSGGVAGQYCTRLDCTSDDDCGEGYACNSAGARPFCQRAPLGQGQDCASSSDCEGGDASYCEVFQSKVCLVPDCSLKEQDCFVGWECCDLTSIPVQGLPASVCAPAGRCP